MDKQNRKRQHVNDNGNDNGDKDHNQTDSEWMMDLLRGMEEGTSRNNNNSANANDLKELKWKMTAYEAKVQMLEAELKCAKMEAKMLENSLEKWKTSFEAQQIEAAKNLDKKMEHFKMELTTLLEEKQQTEIAEFKEQLKRQGIKLDQIKPDWGRLMKDKRLEKTTPSRWSGANTKAKIKISEDGLEVSYNKDEWQFVYTSEQFCISDQICRKDNFGGIIIRYFEVTKISSSSDWPIFIALSNGNNSEESLVSSSPNCYAFGTENDYCWLSGKIHEFQWPNGAIKPEWNGLGDVVGCGLLLMPGKEVSIFFTANGILMGKQIPIGYPGDRLFPTVQISNASVKANFGDNQQASPFKYDIDNCPGFIFDD